MFRATFRAQRTLPEEGIQGGKTTKRGLLVSFVSMAVLLSATAAILFLLKRSTNRPLSEGEVSFKEERREIYHGESDSGYDSLDLTDWDAQGFAGRPESVFERPSANNIHFTSDVDET
jgi:hypothetical protein